MGHGPDAKRSVKCDECQKGGKSFKNEEGGLEIFVREELFYGKLS